MPSAYRRIQKIIIMKTIGICSDHAGYALKQYVKQWLETKGWEYKDFGTYSPESVDYPDLHTRWHWRWKQGNVIRASLSAVAETA